MREIGVVALQGGGRYEICFPFHGHHSARPPKYRLTFRASIGLRRGQKVHLELPESRDLHAHGLHFHVIVDPCVRFTLTTDCTDTYVYQKVWRAAP